jgi:hypothetical protein
MRRPRRRQRSLTPSSRSRTALQQDLAAAPTLADGAAILAQLEQNRIDLRAKRLQLVKAQEALALAQSQVARSQTILAREAGDLARAAALKSTEQQEDKKRSGWKAAIGQPPLDALKAAAGTALGASPYTSAKTRVEADIPADLITRARQRRDQEQARVDRLRQEVETAEDALDNMLELTGGLAGASAKKRRAFDRAETSFGDYVLSAKQRFDRAIALLAPIAAAPALTAEEQARINDVTIKKNGSDAAAKEKDRDAAQAVVDQNQVILDDATMTAIAAGKDPASETPVQKAKTDLDTAEGKLNTAKNAYTTPMRKDLDTWEAAVPDAAWRRLADFQEADAILNDVKKPDPSALAKAMTDAESALADALDAEAAGAETTSFLQDSAQARDQRLGAASLSEPSLLFSALRGDG